MHAGEQALRVAMADASSVQDPALRLDYRALLQTVDECGEFSKPDREQVAVWVLRAVLHNELHTDDTYEVRPPPRVRARRKTACGGAHVASLADRGGGGVSSTRWWRRCGSTSSSFPCGSSSKRRRTWTRSRRLPPVRRRRRHPKNHTSRRLTTVLSYALTPPF